MNRAGVALLAASLAAAACKDDVTPPVTPPAVPVPQLVSNIPVPRNFGVHDSYIRDGIAFVCAWNTGVIIYDVGNGIKGGSPANPVEVSRIVPDSNGIPGGPQVHNAWWFWNPVSGEHRYVFLGQEGAGTIGSSSQGDIHVIDVFDLTKPTEVAFYHLNASPPAGTHNFWVDEPAQVLYAAYYNGGVVALDVSGTLTGNLAPSREIARFKPASNTFMWGVHLSGTSLYATDMLNGLWQIRLSGGAFSTVGGGANVLERYSGDLWVGNGYVYTGTWGGQPRAGVFGNALKIWKLDVAGAPSLADSIVYDSITTVADVKGSDDGKLLVVATENGPKSGVSLYSLANPAKPLLVARSIVPSGVHTARLAEIGGRRYVFGAQRPNAVTTPALLIYDVTAFAP